MKRVLCLMLMLPALSWATTYKCVHEGKVTYSTNPCGKDGQEMRFHDNRTATDSKLVVYMDKSRSYRTQGTVNGQPVNFVIDTGASKTSISLEVAEAAGIKECTRASVSATAGGLVRTCVAKVSELTFGSFHVYSTEVIVMPSLPVDALLGMDVLGRMKIQQEFEVLTITNQ
jgi:clan AA aspartic protease (TIGR02281 family)